MKTTNKIVLLVMSLVLAASLTACTALIDGLGDVGGDSLVGYYTKLDKLAKTSQFNRINQAIDDHELLSSYSSTKYYATKSLFFESDGRWYSSAARFGDCRYMPKNSSSVSTYSIDVLEVVNQNTLIKYSAWLWNPSKVSSGTKTLGGVYGGENIGNLVYAVYTEHTYTYSRLDNKLFLSNGDIYTIVNGGLVKDGSSGVLERYNP